MSEYFIYYIDREECIGDSLDKINLSFSNLDTSMQYLSTTSHSWVLDTSSAVVSTNNWVEYSRLSIENTNSWFFSNSSSLETINLWAKSLSASINRSSSWVVSNSSISKNVATWTTANSTVLTYIASTYAFERTLRYSILPKSDHAVNLNILNSEYSSLLGGDVNTLDGDYSVVGGGLSNNLQGNKSVIVGGESNKVIGQNNGIVGGAKNSLSGENNFIGGGNDNAIEGGDSSILGGSRNFIEGAFAAIVGGIDNRVVHNNSYILGSHINSTAPNTTYVNNLNIVDIPAVDNNSNAVLIRGSNGAINVRLVNNIQNIDPTFTWVKQNSANTMDIISWAFNNSAGFTNNTYIDDVSANLRQTLNTTVSTLTTGDVFSWVHNNSADIATVAEWRNLNFYTLSAITTWMHENSAKVYNSSEFYAQNTVTRKYTRILDITTTNQTFVIDHQWNTRDIIAQVYNEEDGNTVFVDIDRVSNNNVVVSFGNINSGKYKLILIG